MVIAAGGPEASIPHRTFIYLASASYVLHPDVSGTHCSRRIAELFADVLLTPLEATRIRLVSDRTYASGLVPGFIRMAREGGLAEFYSGFIPILFKQIPYACGVSPVVMRICADGATAIRGQRGDA